MKIPKEWWLEIGDLKIMPMPRHRPVPRRPPWIIILVSLACVLLIAAYIYPPGQLEACYFFSSSSFPFEKLWEKFFLGHEERFSIHVHASREKPKHVSPLFIDRDIHSKQVVWGKITMVDAEKRLLANALQDTDNQHFILLSDSSVPLHNFDYVYNYLMDTNVSFIDWHGKTQLLLRRTLSADSFSYD